MRGPRLRFGFRGSAGEPDAPCRTLAASRKRRRVVSRTKDPFAFAELCRELGVAHPPSSAAPPPDPKGWLRKRIGGAGGTHVRPRSGRAEDSGRIYFQRQVAGRAVSLLFLANGKDTLPLGFSAQWSHPTAEAPARYGGAVRPAGIGPRAEAQALHGCRQVSPAASVCVA